MSKKIPTLVKIIAALLLLTGLIELFFLISNLITYGFPANAHQVGKLMGAIMRPGLPLIAGIGLFSLQRWAVHLTAFHLILSGVTFILAFIRGFKQVHSNIIEPTVLIVIASIIMITVGIIRYLYQTSKEINGKPN